MYKREINKDKKDTFICQECSTDLNNSSMYFYNDVCYCQGCCPWKKPKKTSSLPSVTDLIQSINLQI